MRFKVAVFYLNIEVLNSYQDICLNNDWNYLGNNWSHQIGQQKLLRARHLEAKEYAWNLYWNVNMQKNWFLSMSTSHFCPYLNRLLQRMDKSFFNSFKKCLKLTKMSQMKFSLNFGKVLNNWTFLIWWRLHFFNGTYNSRLLSDWIIFSWQKYLLYSFKKIEYYYLFWLNFFVAM